jgi:hypothetical protein
MDNAVRGHVIVALDDERIVLLRQIRGSVSYVAPGVPVQADELPGQAAARAARDVFGIDVEIDELVFADTELGAEHFYFSARPLDPFDLDLTAPVPLTDDVSITALKRATLLAYPIRPTGMARRLRQARDGVP